MDKIDKKILAELQADGRLSVTELAHKVGLSLSPCHRRVKALEDTGIIKGYRAQLDISQLGLNFSTIVFVTDCSSLGMENIKIEKVLVFPNPAKDVLYLQSPKEVQKIEIFDMSGRKILQKNVNKKEDQINIEILKSGIYILKTYTDNSSQTFKIIKKD